MTADAIADSAGIETAVPRSGVFSFLLAVLAFAVLAAAPMYVSTYTVTLLVRFAAYGIALLGFNILMGYTGLLSFGHAMFIAIGAYTAAVFSSELGVLYLEIILLAAAAVSAAASFLIGLFCVRYTKIFFSMLTLAFGMTFHSFLNKFYFVTGGDQGMRIERPLLAGLESAGGKTAFITGPFYYYSLALLAILAFVAWRIVHSPLGLHMRAVRDNPQKAAYLGIEVRRTRLWAFVISAVYGAIAGVLIGVDLGQATPDLGYWTDSGALVFMTVLGGSGSFGGPALGGLVFVFLHAALKTATEYWRFVLGSILVAIVVFAPRGVAGLVQGLLRKKA